MIFIIFVLRIVLDVKEIFVDWFFSTGKCK